MDRLVTKALAWCNEHQKATAVIVAVVVGVIVGAVLFR